MGSFGFVSDFIGHLKETHDAEHEKRNGKFRIV